MFALARMPSVEQILRWFEWDDSTGHRAAVCAIITFLILLSPVICGFLLHLFVNLQMKILSRVNDRFAYAFVNYVTFPGTIFHETSHLLLALVTGAKVLEVKFLKSDGDELGYVLFRNRGPRILAFVQDALISCAPTVLGVVGSATLLEVIFHGGYEWWQYALLWYALVSLLDHSSMSVPDLKLFFRGIWIFVLPVFAWLMWL